jgi:hypothetical protein
VVASLLGDSSSSSESLDFSIGSMMREDDGKETRVQEACVKIKEELGVERQGRRRVGPQRRWDAAVWPVLARGSM